MDERANGFSLDLFAPEEGGAGSLAIDLEVCAVIGAVLHQAQSRGESREKIAGRMSFFAGEKIGPNSLGDWVAPSHPHHRITLARAAAFDAAVGGDPLLNLLAAKRGRRVITSEEAALVELGRIHREERELAARKKALEVLLKGGGR